MSNSELKNVLVIGASSGGATLARALEQKLPATHRVVLVDAQAFSFYPIAALRAAVVPGWEDKVFADLSTFYPAGSRHVVLPETRVVELGEGFVEVSRANDAKGFGIRIPFDICVIATGSTYGAPMRLIADSIPAAKDSLRALQKDVEQAKTIVLVGGGTVGIEFAGEILERFPSKKVTILQSSNRLLSPQWSTKLSDRLAADLKSLGAEIIFGQKVAAEEIKQKSGPVTLADGRQIQADLIFATAGITINSQIVRAAAPGALDAKGFVKVDEFLRVVSKEGPFASSTYFAIGDVADSPGGPTAMSAGNDAGAVTKSIIALASGSKQLTKVPPPIVGIVIPCGSKKGQSSLPMVGVLGNWVTSKIKGSTLFVDKFAGLYPYAKSLESPPTAAPSSSSIGAPTLVLTSAVLVGAAAVLLVKTGRVDKHLLGPAAALF